MVKVSAKGGGRKRLCGKHSVTGRHSRCAAGMTNNADNLKSFDKLKEKNNSITTSIFCF
jgi:hypothetical protein